MQKFFILCLLAFGACAGHAPRLRFLAAELNDFKDAQQKCWHEPVDCCSIQAKNFGGSDNAYCATTPDSAPLFAQYCGIKECTALSNDVQGELIMTVTGSNWDALIDADKSLAQKIGLGPRRSMMNPNVYGAWACQSWAQLSDIHGQSVVGAKFFAFDTQSNVCLLLAEKSTSDAAARAAVEMNGMLIKRSCNVRDAELNYISFSDEKSNKKEITATCSINPSSPLCKKLDVADTRNDPGACATVLDEATCVVSEEVATQCYASKSKAVLPARKIAVSSADSVRSFLANAGETFWDFAGRVGFSQPPTALGRRTRTMVPAEAGEFACRNLLQLRDNNGRFIKSVDMAFYDPAEKTCYLFLEEDYNAAQETDDRYITGPAFC